MKLLKIKPELWEDFDKLCSKISTIPAKDAMTLTEALKFLGNLQQSKETVPEYFIRFKNLMRITKLSREDCLKLFYNGLKPELLNALNIRGNKETIEETVEELSQIENQDVDKSSKPAKYNFRPRNKDHNCHYLTILLDWNSL